MENGFRVHRVYTILTCLRPIGKEWDARGCLACDALIRVACGEHDEVSRALRKEVIPVSIIVVMSIAAVSGYVIFQQASPASSSTSQDRTSTQRAALQSSANTTSSASDSQTTPTISSSISTSASSFESNSTASTTTATSTAQTSSTTQTASTASTSQTSTS